MSLYEILELKPNASILDIKKSYRKLAKRYHPDKSGYDSNDHFQKINYAYEILSDDKSRKEYHSMNNLDQHKFENLISKILNKNININDLKNFGISFDENQLEYIGENLKEFLDKLNFNDIMNLFIYGKLPKFNEDSFNLCSDSEIDVWDENQAIYYYKLPMKFSQFNKNNIKLDLDITIQDLFEQKKRKIKLNRNINNSNYITTFIFDIKKPYIIFNGGGDIDDEIGNLIIKLNLPDGFTWSENLIVLNHPMNLYEMIYGMNVNIDLGFKKIDIKSWTPSRDGYLIVLNDVKILNENLAIKFNLNYNHSEEKELILLNYFKD